MKQTTRSTSRSSMRSTALLRSRMARVNRLVFVTMRYPRFNDVSVRTSPPTGCEAGLDENDRKQEHAKDVVLADIDEDLARSGLCALFREATSKGCPENVPHQLPDVCC